MILTYLSRSWGSISTCKCSLFTCKYDNLQILFALGPILYHGCISVLSFLDKFEDGWPWPIFQGHGGRFQHTNLHFSLANTIPHQILLALGPYISGVFGKVWRWMTWTYFWGHVGQFQHNNLQFSLINRIPQLMLVSLGPNLHHGYISGESWLSSKMDVLDIFSKVMGVYFNMKICTFACKHDNSTTISRIWPKLIGPKLILWMYLRVSWLSSKMDDLF